MKKISILLFSLLITCISMAYGPIAHRAIAIIAQNELQPGVYEQIDELLGTNGIVYQSTWADEIRDLPQYAESKPWHYQNLSPDKTPEQLAELWNNPEMEGKHLFYAIQLMQQRLRKDKTDVDALKFLIHFMGDLHQPMHLGRADDLGGNRVPFTWFGKQINIHSLWDSYLIDHYKMSYTELAQYLIDTYSPEKKKMAAMTIPSILEKSFDITRRIYDYDPEDKNNYKYFQTFRSDLDTMMYLGGIQLAKILNELYQ